MFDHDISTKIDSSSQGLNTVKTAIATTEITNALEERKASFQGAEPVEGGSERNSAGYILTLTQRGVLLREGS